MTSLNEPKAEILDTALNDTLENLVASLGTEADKRSHSRFTNRDPLTFDYVQLTDMYRTDWATGKTVDIVPDDMTREWRTILSNNLDPDIIRKIVQEEKRLGVRKAFNQAHKWGRLFGGGIIVMAIDDGNSPEEPLEIDKIKLGGLRHIKVVDRHEFTIPSVITENPLNPNYGFPEVYTINRSSVRIHHSRILRFDGIEIPFREMQRNHYWHESVIPRLYDNLINFSTVQNAAASMVYETNVDIMKIKGLMNYLQTQQGMDLVKKRFAMAKLLKSFNNMLLLDSEEEHEVKTNSFSGLPDLLDRYAKILASGSDIPATRYLGESPGGLNSTGESDMKNYYDSLASQQETVYAPKLEHFDQIMLKSLGITIPEGEKLDYEFNPLYQMSEKEIADMNYVNAQRDQIYYNMNVITEDIIAKELVQNKVYDNISDEHLEMLEEAVNPMEPTEEEENAESIDPNSPEGETAGEEEADS